MTERGTHYSVSQHHILRPDDRERYTLQCLTAPHRTTWRQREVHITVFNSTTSYNRRTGGGKKGKKGKTYYSVSPSKNKRQVLASLRCPALSSSFNIENNINFSTVCYACVHTSSRWDVWLLNTHKFPFSVWRSYVVTMGAKRSLWSFRSLIETWKSLNQDTSHTLWQISQVGLWFTILEVFVHRCVYARALRVYECEIRVAVERQPGSNQAW